MNTQLYVTPVCVKIDNCIMIELCLEVETASVSGKILREEGILQKRLQIGADKVLSTHAQQGVSLTLPSPWCICSKGLGRPGVKWELEMGFTKAGR